MLFIYKDANSIFLPPKEDFFLLQALILFIDVSIPNQPAVDPTLRYRGTSSTTYSRAGYIVIQDVVPGDAIRCWLKSRHYLHRIPVGKDRNVLSHLYVGKSGSTARGYFLTEVRGAVAINNTQEQKLHINCSPGALGWPYNFHAQAIVPWLAIRRLEVIRRRITDGVENVRFPLVLPVKLVN